VPEEPLDLRVNGWLEIVRIAQLGEWDVLVFLYRHGTSLASAEQIALLLGYGKRVVGKALDSLVTLGLVQRSRSSQGVRLYRFSVPVDPTCRQSVAQLLKLSEKRSGRLIVARSLGRRPQSPVRSVLHLA
jgi:hypothetical protein